MSCLGLGMGFSIAHFRCSTLPVPLRAPVTPLGVHCGRLPLPAAKVLHVRSSAADIRFAQPAGYALGLAPPYTSLIFLLANSVPSSRAALAWAGSVPVDAPQKTHMLFKVGIGTYTPEVQRANNVFSKLSRRLVTQ